MRKLMLVLSGGTAVAVIAGAAITLSTELVSAGANTRSEQVSINRSVKGDRTPSTATLASSKRQITTVEVVGIDQPAIIYRDRDGRELFRTDPLQNHTAVVRGVTLPAVTVKQTQAAPAPSVVVEQPKANAEQKSPRDHKLPDGCEQSVSPLATTSSLRARCVASLGGNNTVASL
jgi:hypothetical protein